MAEAIEYFFDLSSPYGYFTCHQMEALERDTGRKVVWKPILLGPAFKATGSRPFSEQGPKWDYAKIDWARQAAYLGLPWTLPDPFPVATVATGRIFYWLHDRNPGLAVRFAKVAYQAYFGEGRNISNIDVVVDIATTLGEDDVQTRTAMQDQVYKDRLRHETDEALKRGVFGSPFFLVDGRPFWGSDRLDVLRRWLETGGW